MGKIDRLKRITMAKIEAFLDSLEQPEIVLPQLQRELADKLKEAVNAETKSLTALKASQRRVDEGAGRLLRLKKGAELALRDGDEETARQALAAQVETEEQLAKIEKGHEGTRKAYLNAHDVRKQLQKNLQKLRERVRDVKNRHVSVKAVQKMLEQSQEFSLKAGQEIMDLVIRMEDKVDEMEAQNQILGGNMDTVLLEEKLENLQHSDEVERRLEKMKREINE